MLIYTILTVHLGCVLGSLYMHRYVIHRQYYLDPRAEQVMQILYWILAGTVSREFVVQHRKHHRLSDTGLDPHTPRHGFWSLLFSCLIPSFFRPYRITVNQEDYYRYGVSAPTKESTTFVDKYPRLGVVLLLLLNTLLFGWWGPVIWIIHLFVVNFLTIATITVFGHSVGYRNFDLGDLTRNVIPWGIVCAGEELHNNHHRDGRQCNFAVAPGEFDLGYRYLQILNKFNLVHFK